MSDPSFTLIKTAGGKQIPIAGSMVVGRQAECDLQVQEGLASRRHAQIHLEPDGVWLEDLKSANGTFVNDVRIEEKTKLNSGDRIRFDVEEFEFRATVPSAPEVDDGATRFRKLETPQITAESGVYKRPPSWVDQSALDDGANKTKFIDPKALKALRATPPVNARADKVDAPCLIVQSGSKANMKIQLQPTAAGAHEWTIGSHTDREIVLNEAGVSALHAKIVNEGRRWKLVDQMSANGTFVNDRRSNSSFLSSGDRLRFGPVECVFQTPNGVVRPAAASATSSSAKKIALISAAVAAAALAVFAAWRLL